MGFIFVESFKFFIIIEMTEFIIISINIILNNCIILLLNILNKILLLLFIDLDTFISFILKVKFSEIIVLDASKLIPPSSLHLTGHQVDGDGQHQEGKEGGRTE